jgi:exonuclease VII large subunit
MMALCASSALGQVPVPNSPIPGNTPYSNSQPAPPPTHEISVKSSPAEDMLMSMAEKAQSYSKTYNTMFQQARTNLDNQNKPLLDEFKKIQAKYQQKIEEETKDIRKKMDDNAAAAMDKFTKETAPLQEQAVSPQTITTLENLIRDEQKLPANAHFDVVIKKWVVPDEKK